MATISLPTKDRSFAPYTTGEPIVLPKGAPPKLNRVAYAAAHVVADPLADNDPWLDAAVDWDKTIAFREYLWDLGLGVAEAMDTAQRGMGLDWNGAKELIRRALAAARTSAREAGPVSWSVPTPQAIRPPTARASAAERRISSAAPAQSRPMPRWAVSIASATPSPWDHRWRRKARVASQSTAAGESGDTSAKGSATTCAAE